MSPRAAADRARARAVLADAQTRRGWPPATHDGADLAAGALRREAGRKLRRALLRVALAALAEGRQVRLARGPKGGWLAEGR